MRGMGILFVPVGFTLVTSRLVEPVFRLAELRRPPTAGPNEVTIFHPEVFRTVDGYGSKCSKPDWFVDALCDTIGRHH